MNILINGVGNIGTTLLNILNEYRELLGIKEIYAKKNTLKSWDISDLKFLEKKNIKICTESKDALDLCENELNIVDYNDIKDNIDYIFDTTANKMGIRNLEEYKKMKNLKGASAQGSEKGFGVPYALGSNEGRIKKEKYVNIVSCNTHATLAVLKTFTGNNLENLEEADFVVVRRSEDIGNHERLITANVVARHLDENIGTHHAIDAIDLLKTMGLSPKLTSSDVTTPSQLMHTFRFNIELKEDRTIEELKKMMNGNKNISITNKFDTNKVFELGRRYGKSGRLYSHIIIIENNLLLIEKNIMGWGMIPQEGNTILSTVSAFLLQTTDDYDKYENIIEIIRKDLIINEI